MSLRELTASVMLAAALLAILPPVSDHLTARLQIRAEERRLSAEERIGRMAVREAQIRLQTARLEAKIARTKLRLDVPDQAGGRARRLK